MHDWFNAAAVVVRMILRSALCALTLQLCADVTILCG